MKIIPSRELFFSSEEKAEGKFFLHYLFSKFWKFWTISLPKALKSFQLCNVTSLMHTFYHLEFHKSLFYPIIVSIFHGVAFQVNFHLWRFVSNWALAEKILREKTGKLFNFGSWRKNLLCRTEKFFSLWWENVCLNSLSENKVYFFFVEECEKEIPKNKAIHKLIRTLRITEEISYILLLPFMRKLLIFLLLYTSSKWRYLINSSNMNIYAHFSQCESTFVCLFMNWFYFFPSYFFAENKYTLPHDVLCGKEWENFVMQIKKTLAIKWISLRKILFRDTVGGHWIRNL